MGFICYRLCSLPCSLLSHEPGRFSYTPSLRITLHSFVRREEAGFGFIWAKTGSSLQRSVEEVNRMSLRIIYLFEAEPPGLQASKVELIGVATSGPRWM